MSRFVVVELLQLITKPFQVIHLPPPFLSTFLRHFLMKLPSKVQFGVSHTELKLLSESLGPFLR